MASVRAGVMTEVDVQSTGPMPDSTFGFNAATCAIALWVVAVLVLFVIL